LLKLAPSILAADFGHLADDLAAVGAAGAHYAHIDVMDGHFVPNISLGVPVIQSIRKQSTLVFDVHLMISEPERYVDAFAEAGADIINFHIEATSDAAGLIRRIRGLGKKPAITIKNDTPVEAVFPFAGDVDMILLMSVEPGFGGQAFMPSALVRAKALRAFLEQENLHTDIEMDGGIGLANAEAVLNSGVNVLVAGSSIFGAADTRAAAEAFLQMFRQREHSIQAKKQDGTV